MHGGVLMSKEQRIKQIQGFLSEKFHLPPEQVEELLPDFISALSSHIQNLELALESGDLIQLGRAGHTLKGALLNLGLHDCVDIALDIEQKGKAQDSSVDYQSMLNELKQNLQVLLV